MLKTSSHILGAQPPPASALQMQPKLKGFTPVESSPLTEPEAEKQPDQLTQVEIFMECLEDACTEQDEDSQSDHHLRVLESELPSCFKKILTLLPTKQNRHKLTELLTSKAKYLFQLLQSIPYYKKLSRKDKNIPKATFFPIETLTDIFESYQCCLKWLDRNSQLRQFSRLEALFRNSPEGECSYLRVLGRMMVCGWGVGVMGYAHYGQEINKILIRYHLFSPLITFTSRLLLLVQYKDTQHQKIIESEIHQTLSYLNRCSFQLKGKLSTSGIESTGKTNARSQWQVEFESEVLQHHVNKDKQWKEKEEEPVKEDILSVSSFSTIPLDNVEARQSLLSMNLTNSKQEQQSPIHSFLRIYQTRALRVTKAAEKFKENMNKVYDLPGAVQTCVYFMDLEEQLIPFLKENMPLLSNEGRQAVETELKSLNLSTLVDC